MGTFSLDSSGRPTFISASDWSYVLGDAKKYGVDPYLIAAVGWHETHWGQLGAGKPSQGGYIFGYGVPGDGTRLTKYAGVHAQVDALSKRIGQWQTYEGHSVTSLSDLYDFSGANKAKSGSPLQWSPPDPAGWSSSVLSIFSSLKGKSSTSSSTSSTASATTASSAGSDPSGNWLTNTLGLNWTTMGLWLGGAVLVALGVGALVRASGVDTAAGRLAGRAGRAYVEGGAE